MDILSILKELDSKKENLKGLSENITKKVLKSTLSDTLALNVKRLKEDSNLGKPEDEETPGDEAAETPEMQDAEAEAGSEMHGSDEGDMDDMNGGMEGDDEDMGGEEEDSLDTSNLGVDGEEEVVDLSDADLESVLKVLKTAKPGETIEVTPSMKFTTRKTGGNMGGNMGGGAFGNMMGESKYPHNMFDDDDEIDSRDFVEEEDDDFNFDEFDDNEFDENEFDDENGLFDDDDMIEDGYDLEEGEYMDEAEDMCEECDEAYVHEDENMDENMDESYLDEEDELDKAYENFQRKQMQEAARKRKAKQVQESKKKSINKTPNPVKQVSESAKLQAKFNAMQEALKTLTVENKTLKDQLLKAGKNLKSTNAMLETMMVNYFNLGYTASLFMENTIPAKDKEVILKAFDKVKTVEQSKKLSESLRKKYATLKEGKKAVKNQVVPPAKKDDEPLVESKKVADIKNAAQQIKGQESAKTSNAETVKSLNESSSRFAQLVNYKLGDKTNK